MSYVSHILHYVALLRHVWADNTKTSAKIGIPDFSGEKPGHTSRLLKANHVEREVKGSAEI
jgi:hypothetical protein